MDNNRYFVFFNDPSIRVLPYLILIKNFKIQKESKIILMHSKWLTFLTSEFKILKIVQYSLWFKYFYEVSLKRTPKFVLDERVKKTKWIHLLYHGNIMKKFVNVGVIKLKMWRFAVREDFKEWNTSNIYFL